MEFKCNISSSLHEVKTKYATLLYCNFKNQITLYPRLPRNERYVRMYIDREGGNIKKWHPKIPS